MEKAIIWIYENSGFRERIFSYLRKIGATPSECEDIWQDGICAMVLNVRNERFTGSSTIDTYLHAICKNIFFGKKKRAMKLMSIKEKVDRQKVDIYTPEVLYLQKERSEILRNMLNNLGSICQNILELWSMNHSMREIASIMQYKSEGMARKKKHQCMQRLMSVAHKNKIQMR